MVSTSTPASAQAMVMRRTFSVPAWCPARRGSPRRIAQRPLPSMMMPTWAGIRRGSSPSSASAPAASANALDLHDLGLLALGHLVHAMDELVGQLLEPVLGAALVLGRDPAVLLGLAQAVERIAAAVAHGDARLLGPLMDLLDQFLAALLGQL